MTTDHRAEAERYRLPGATEGEDLFGRVVEFTAVINRESEEPDLNDPRWWTRPIRRIWKRHEMNGSGLVIGWRTLSEGKVANLGEDGSLYQPDRFFRALLVVQNERSNPVRVLPEDIVR